jgi:eukaryotic-like serine/threonine-protein kinase
MRSLTPSAFVAPGRGAPYRTSLGDCLGGRYSMLQPLGLGAVSRVFLARDGITDSLVAVKVMYPYGPESVVTPDRFDAEVRVGLGVPHDNVARVLDSGTSEWGEPYVVTEALEGETLGERLRRERTLSPRDALCFAMEAARGLAAIHRAGYVHRDVKPDNLFLCEPSSHGVRLKVIDFGFCTPVEEVNEAERRVMGTLEYLAPEQAIAERVDARSDVYSLGVVLFRTITGELPFDACAKRGILTHQLISPLPPPSWLVEGLDAGTERVVCSATRKHPDNRYASMDELICDVQRVLEGDEARGTSLRVAPDAYRPTTDRGRAALETLSDEL